MLNRRHKVVLFLTLVTTACALLSGAKLSESLGMLMLGGTFAWVIGSATVSRGWIHFRGLFGEVWPSLRLFLLMAFAGSVFVALAVWSNFNSFLVIAGMSLIGVLISRWRDLPTQRRWLRWLAWIAGVAALLVSSGGAMMLSDSAQRHAERVGELVAYGTVALLIGAFWLVKGWNLTGYRVLPLSWGQPKGGRSPAKLAGQCKICASAEFLYRPNAQKIRAAYPHLQAGGIRGQ